MPNSDQKSAIYGAITLTTKLILDGDSIIDSETVVLHPNDEIPIDWSIAAQSSSPEIFYENESECPLGLD
jgi:hypothetical protein